MTEDARDTPLEDKVPPDFDILAHDMRELYGESPFDSPEMGNVMQSVDFARIDDDDDLDLSGE